MEIVESKHDLFNAGAKEQLCKADEAPIVARLTVDVAKSCPPEVERLNSNAITNKEPRNMEMKQKELC